MAKQDHEIRLAIIQLVEGSWIIKMFTVKEKALGLTEMEFQTLVDAIAALLTVFPGLRKVHKGKTHEVWA